MTLLGSGCSVFSWGSGSKAESEPPAADGQERSAPAGAEPEDEAEEIVDFSGLSENAAHPALAHYARSVDWALSAEREEVAPMWGVDIGHTARTSIEPTAIYLYAVERTIDNGGRVVEHCGAPRLAEKLRGVEPLDSPAAAGSLAESVSGWSQAGQSEAEASPGDELESYQAKRCVASTMERIGKTLTAAAQIDDTHPHHRGGDVVAGWAETLAMGRSLGSPWPVPEQATRELAAFARFVRKGKRTDVRSVKVKPVHPGLVLLIESIRKVVDPAGYCELLGHDLSDTARGSNGQAFVYASNVALRTFPDLLETCDAKEAAELARSSMPKPLRKLEDVDKVFDALAPIFDPESSERLCIQKASYALRETLSEANRAASDKRSGINDTLPYADKAFARFPDIVARAEQAPEGRNALAAALLGDTIAQLRKWRRRPAKDLRRYAD